MGVKGFWKTLRSNYQRDNWSFEEKLPPKSILLVDATSFIFHTLDVQLNKLYSQFELKRNFGGVYDVLKEVLSLEVQRLTIKLGFELIFYFDGPDSYHKGNTILKRREQITEKWRNMFFDGMNETKAQEDLPIPPLFVQALAFVLKNLKIEFKQLQGEADQTIAIDCNDLNDIYGVNMIFCYSSDSDFLVMKGAQTIRMGDLDDATTNLDEGLSVIVWRRSSIAENLCVSEIQLIYWTILYGNDFTQQYSYFDFGLNNIHVRQEKLLEMLSSGDLDWHPDMIENEDCRQAVQYSITFYELADLSPFMLSKYKTVNQLDELTVIEDEYSLTTFMKTTIKSLFDKRVQLALPIPHTGYELGRFALEALETFLSEQQTSNNSHFISLKHILSLGNMLSVLTNDLSHDQIVFQGTHPTFEDQKVANIYQLTVREILKLVNSLNANKMKVIDPSKCYNGILFHNFMLDISHSEDTLHRSTNEIHIFDHSCDKQSDFENTRVENDCDYFDNPSVEYCDDDLIDEKEESNCELNENCDEYDFEDTDNGRNLDAYPAASTKSHCRLPCDAFRAQIIQQVKNERVSIIQGETGSGKSSRVPIFLMEDLEANKMHCRILVTQPRRIAVVNLKNRLKEIIGDKVGMRMGQGVREETRNTKIYFVTAGYMVKLLAYRPESLSNITHLIIDEVHERSLDSDLLCFLTKRCLKSYSNVRLVLMSATLNSSLYANYFYGNHIMTHTPPLLHVGKRQFPIYIFHLNNLLSQFQDKAKPKIEKMCNEIAKLIAFPQKGSTFEVPSRLAELQYKLAFELICAKGKKGTGILVFVSGLNDILAMHTMFSGKSGYEFVAIHSELPFDEQENALFPPSLDKIKLIVATNSAESSITLPNVDIVICLGTCKEVDYQEKLLQRATLENTWISKSSAIQRAGRTGRIRAGTVYRLYTEEVYTSFREFEKAEIHRKPLHDVILSLKVLLKEAREHSGVIPILSTMIEEPDLSKIDESFSFLHHQEMISAPNDAASLTSRGLFTGTLALDVSLSKLIMYGINLGVGPEAVLAAAALSQPKSLFRTAHPIIHTDPMEFNSITRSSFLGTDYFDAGVYSDSIRMIRIFVEVSKLNPRATNSFCYKHGLILPRVDQFVSSANYLLYQVSSVLLSLHDKTPFKNGYYSREKMRAIMNFGDLQFPIPANKLNRLRLAHLWALNHNLIMPEGRRGKSMDFDPSLNEVRLPLDLCPSSVIDELFPPDIIPRRVDRSGKFAYSIPAPFQGVEQLSTGLRPLMQHLMAHEEVYFVSCSSEDSALLLVRENEGRSEQLINLLRMCNPEDALQFVSKLDNDHAPHNPLALYAYDKMKAPHRFLSVVEKAPGLVLQAHADETATLHAFYVPVSVELLQSLYSSHVPSTVDFVTVMNSKTVRDAFDRITFLPDTENTSLYRPIFPDLFVGTRLFNAYSLGYQNRKLRFGLLPNKSRKVLIEEEKQSNKNKVKSFDSKAIVSRWGIISDSWVASKGGAGQSANRLSFQLPDTNRMIPVKMKSLFLSTSCQGPHPHHALSSCPSLFGVSHTATLLLDSNQVLVDGVTLFPQGKDWIERALSCVGKCLDRETSSILDATPLSTHQVTYTTMCRFVRELMSRHKSVTRSNPILIEAVDLLFVEFLSNDSLTIEETEDIADRYLNLIRIYAPNLLWHKKQNQFGNRPFSTPGAGPFLGSQIQQAIDNLLSTATCSADATSNTVKLMDNVSEMLQEEVPQAGSNISSNTVELIDNVLEKPHEEVLQAEPTTLISTQKTKETKKPLSEREKLERRLLSQTIKYSKRTDAKSQRKLASVERKMMNLILNESNTNENRSSKKYQRQKQKKQRSTETTIFSEK